MNDTQDFFAAELGEQIRSAGRAAPVPVGLVERLTASVTDPATVRGLAPRRRPPTWLLPLAAAAAVAAVTVPLVLVSHRSAHPATSSTPHLAPPAPTASATSTPTATHPTHASSTVAAPPASQRSTPSQPGSTPVAAGGNCGPVQNFLGIADASIVVQAGHVYCWTTQHMLAAYRASAAPMVASGQAIGPISVDGWQCQSGPVSGRDQALWTVCTSPQGTVSVGAGSVAPRPWVPFSTSLGDAPQFYYDDAGRLRYYTTHAAWGTSSCRTGSFPSVNPPGPSASSLGIDVTVSAVHVSGRMVYGAVTVKNVSSAAVTYAESYDIATDGVVANGAQVTPLGSWDGPELGDRSVTLAPGESVSAVHQLPAYDCAGAPLPAGSYAAQFYVVLDVQVSQGTYQTFAYPADTAPAIQLG